MLAPQAIAARTVELAAQAEIPPLVLFGETEIDLWPYRPRTMALLRRYARASVEVGRLPSLLGREFFRSRVTSYTMRSFEDTMVFVTDMEHTLDKLDIFDRRLIAMYVLEECRGGEVARVLGCSERTGERLFHEAIDRLSKSLLIRGLLEKLPETQ